MFGNPSLPARVFSYGASAPIQEGEAVAFQMRLARRYRNALVRLELRRRRKTEELLLETAPRLSLLGQEIESLQSALNQEREKIRATNKAVMASIPPVRESTEQIRALKSKLASLWKTVKAERKLAFASRKFKDLQKNLYRWASDGQKRLRAAAVRTGLYWGTYLHVEGTVKRSGRPPRFSRWDGSGHLAVQLIHGLPVGKALSGDDPRVRVELCEEGVFRPGKTRPKRLGNAVLRFRIGSLPSREPVMASVPFTLHRPLPEDAAIKWLHVLRHRVGTHAEWAVQFVLSRKSGWNPGDRAKSGTVALDVGWRLLEDGSLRVARWNGSDGRSGDIALPPDWLIEMKRTEFIRSVRDRNFEGIKKTLRAWLTSDGRPKGWVDERVGSISQWKAAARLAALALQWREHRMEGDSEVFSLVEAWRQRDRHLYEFEANLRDQLLRRRKDLYRKELAALRRAYRTAVIEDLDLRSFHRLPEAETPKPDGALREHVRDACLSGLLNELKLSMGVTLKKDSKNTTRKCPDCGYVCPTSTKGLLKECPKCGRVDDQDDVAGRNLLQG